MKVSSAKKLLELSKNYQAFEQLDGSHPWAKVVPEGAVLYRVRELNQGDVVYFNFDLAREMGMIHEQHPDRMNTQLSEKLINTFSIQIINEYDELKKTKFDPKTIKPGKYMATRYLQLQHPSRTGKTSGDGRGIWNGTIQHKGKIWDVSSRGTGVTCLSPGSVEANKPLKTGNTSFGYGCGLAEIDELMAAIVQSEIFYHQGIPTERVLCVIDLGNGVGIGVRAAPNLLRPAHLLPFLKQGRRKELTTACDYLIDRQNRNKRWSIGPTRKYEKMLSQMTEQFGQFMATLESEYVFAWIDWDGDNVLADAGIIDYGSIRQFGLKHDRYRYDDVDRFSTTLTEQKKKARTLIQVMAQMVDFIVTGKRLPLTRYANHSAAKYFDRVFEQTKMQLWLKKIGFSDVQIKKMHLKSTAVQDCFAAYEALEHAKSSEGPKKVPDGVNHAALFDMRGALRELAAYLAKSGLQSQGLAPETFLQTILSHRSSKKDQTGLKRYIEQAQIFQKTYIKLLRSVMKSENEKSFLNKLSERSQQENRRDRMTGNALIQITNELVERRKDELTPDKMQAILDLLIANYESPIKDEPKASRLRVISSPELYDEILNLIQEHRHDI